MSGLSISFTLGKASVKHGANVEHNNREFTAKNINEKKSHENITYVRQDVREAYKELFADSVAQYNEKQKQPCRRINDYYSHIANGKREEAFYELIVQFGDSKTAPCGSENGRIAKNMLDDYIKNFKQRNPNLHIFNAVLHMDEASPHLHINFIPYYTKGRINGLQKGVSMKAALNEQGFTAKNYKENRLVAWEESERIFMEKILEKHGFTRDDKNAKYAHQTVEDFKKTRDEKKIIKALRANQQISEKDLQAESILQLRKSLTLLEKENKNLQIEKLSPYKPFYYSSAEKQSFVQARLDELKIPYRETENGFEAQECFVDVIRKIEKEYKPQTNTLRDKLRENIDRLLMSSDSLDELIEKLQKENFTIKKGKYISVKPVGAKNFIRLKSLGELYSEFALRNRINARKKYESDLQKTISSAKKKDSPDIVVVRTMKFYTVAFKDGALPMRKKNFSKPFAWTNDSELDRLTELNKKINSGATLESLRNEFEQAEKNLRQAETEMKKSEADLKTFYRLKEEIQMIFEGKPSKIFSLEQAKADLKKYPNITESNYHNVDTLINTELENFHNAENKMLEAQAALKQAADIFSAAEKVMGGTYVQSLVADERERREAKYIPNGLKNS